MTAVFLLAAVAAGCVQASVVLADARWTHRSPAAAIVLWQAIGLGWGLATVGTLIGLATAGQGSGVADGALNLLARLTEGRLSLPSVGLLTAARLTCLAAGLVLFSLLVCILLAASAAVLRARQRQRMLLSLLAHGDPKVPGALVVDYPAAAAYCLPGLRSAIVISAGTLDLLDSAELAAVLAHERAHVRERHDLVLLPFIALLSVLSWCQAARAAHRAVALLVEMHADDRARSQRPARELATALLRVGAAGGCQAPSGALAVAEPETAGEVAQRVTRLLRPASSLPVAALVLVGAAAALAVTAPVAVLFMPF
jgi:Zn-dependent protease with chaperone function